LFPGSVWHNRIAKRGTGRPVPLFPFWSFAVTIAKDRLPLRIVTDRLVLATPTTADIPAIAKHCNNKNVHKWMARLPFPYAEADARFFIEEIVPSAEEFCLGIYHHHVLTGIVGLHFSQNQAPELGYWLAEEHWGRGFATEAAIALVAAARSAGASALRSRALTDNLASRAVLRKAGFKETGTIVEKENNLAGREMVTLLLEFDDD
jgi:RimJ/RimL family protein N-acetyltransferase